MPCLLMHRPCKVCGEFHDFYLADGELFTDQRYECECPKTGQTEYLWDILSVRAVDEPPPDGVEIHSTGSESGRRNSGI